ncbi:hypothetical protein ABW20_dc0100040 [Dactylellina cionopaga]|nr:hypothetical protein ABW20_dc0100040 [Dactylellina cionopaga]
MPPPEEVTAEGINEDDDDALARVSSMIKVLTKLRGIGPATATAILSYLYPVTIPMFSDEAFRWLMMDESTASGGWNRKIAYDAKEYAEFFKRARQLCRKMVSEGEEVTASSVEKVGWILGQEAALGLTHHNVEGSKMSTIGGATGQRDKEFDNILSADSELSKPKVTDGLETNGGLSKTSAKRKDISAYIPLRRSKRNKEA